MHKLDNQRRFPQICRNGYEASVVCDDTAEVIANFKSTAKADKWIKKMVG